MRTNTLFFCIDAREERLESLKKGDGCGPENCQ